MGLKIDAFKNILKNISFQALVNDGDKTLNLMKMKMKKKKQQRFFSYYQIMLEYIRHNEMSDPI